MACEGCREKPFWRTLGQALWYLMKQVIPSGFLDLVSQLVFSPIFLIALKNKLMKHAQQSLWDWDKGAESYTEPYPICSQEDINFRIRLLFCVVILLKICQSSVQALSMLSNNGSSIGLSYWRVLHSEGSQNICMRITGLSALPVKQSCQILRCNQREKKREQELPNDI